MVTKDMQKKKKKKRTHVIVNSLPSQPQELTKTTNCMLHCGQSLIGSPDLVFTAWMCLFIVKSPYIRSVTFLSPQSLKQIPKTKAIELNPSPWAA